MDDDIDKALSVLTHIFDGSWRPRALAPDVLLQVCQDLVEEKRVRSEGKRGQDHSRGLFGAQKGEEGKGAGIPSTKTGNGHWKERKCPQKEGQTGETTTRTRSKGGEEDDTD